MTKITLKKIKGKEYVYLEKSLRVKESVRNISKYIGKAKEVSKNQIKQAKKEFNKELLEKEAELKTNYWYKKNKLTYPLTREEVKKIEIMNTKYKKIIKNLHPKNITDLNRRFIANYVFESNALEGNSLTLKNVAEIIFKKRVSSGKDLREIYDAQNSFNLFLYLQKTREKISDEFIIKIHRKMMKDIDDRLGYRKVPIMLIGKTTKLTAPEEIKEKMDDLLNWYYQNENILYPLELAFIFHAKFEKIHPFCDGNGRVGRFLLNYILMRKGYFPIIIRKTSRNTYFKALEAADKKKWHILIRFALDNYKKTFRKFFEIFYKYV